MQEAVVSIFLSKLADSVSALNTSSVQLTKITYYYIQKLLKKEKSIPASVLARRRKCILHNHVIFEIWV